MVPHDAQSVIASTVDLSRWCEGEAQRLDLLILESENRPLSIHECASVINGQRELLRRIGGQQNLIAEMVFHRAAPWWLWWRALAFGMIRRRT